MLDCRGMACPQPVLRTKELLTGQALDAVEVLLDNQAASENVSRFLGTQGFDAVVEPKGADFLVTGRKNPEKEVSQGPPPETYTCAVEGKRTLVFVRSDCLGHGDDALGAALMKNCLATLKEMTGELWRIIFLNSGVKLCCQGSESLPALQELADGGVGILVCGTCLDHFGLLEQKQVGETTNMLDVVTSLQLADKVITV